jgi:hypothetical protein
MAKGCAHAFAPRRARNVPDDLVGKDPHAGGSLRDAQAQLGHSKMSTTLEIYTLPIPEQQRAAVEKHSVLMANDGRNDQNPERLPLASQQIQ